MSIRRLPALVIFDNVGIKLFCMNNHFMFSVSFFFIQFCPSITDDVFCNVADTDCAVNILQQQNRPNPCKILYLQTVFQCFVCRFNPLSHMVQFRNLPAIKDFRWQVCDEYFFLPFWQRYFNHPQGNDIVLNHSFLDNQIFSPFNKKFVPLT